MKAKESVAALAALAHEHRLAVYRMLVEAGPNGLPAGIIAERLGIVPSSLTFHLQQLVWAGLIARRRASRQIIYATRFEAMNALLAYLTENCCGGTELAVCAAPMCRPRVERGKQRATVSKKKSA